MQRATRLTAVASVIAAVLTSTALFTAPSALAADCPSGTRTVWSGRHTGCEIANSVMKSPHGNAYFVRGQRVLAVVGAGYRTYYAVNDGPFHRFGNGVVNPNSGGIFYHGGSPYGGGEAVQGYFKINGTDGAMYCADARAQPNGVPVGVWACVQALFAELFAQPQHELDRVGWHRTGEVFGRRERGSNAASTSAS